MDQLFDYFRDGGWAMWPLLGCAIASLAIVIARAMGLRRGALIDPVIIKDIRTQAEQGRVDVIISRYRHHPLLAASIVAGGLQDYRATAGDAATCLLKAGERGLRVLNKNLTVLGAIATVAPLLGLLGTTSVLIAGSGGMERFAEDVRLALIPTAFGLAIAIPTVVAAAFFRSRASGLHAAFEEVFADVIDSVKAGIPKKLSTEPSFSTLAPNP